jgi:hypothetical protein
MPLSMRVRIFRNDGSSSTIKTRTLVAIFGSLAIMADLF